MLIGADVAGLKGYGVKWKRSILVGDGWTQDCWESGSCMDANITGYHGSLFQAILLEDGIPPETFERSKGTSFFRIRRGFASETCRPEDLVKTFKSIVHSFIHSSNLVQIPAMCQPLFLALKNQWWIKQSFCPHEA